MRKSDVSFDIKADGDVQIMSISGQLDAFTLSDLKNELSKLTGANRTKIVMNLGRVDSVNSAAIGAIVAVARQVRKRKGDVKLCSLTDEIRKVFGLLGVSKMLEIFKTEQKAIKSF